MSRPVTVNSASHKRWFMSAEEEKSVRDKVLIDYADIKKTVAVLQEEAHQIGKQLSGLAEILQSGNVSNLALDSYQKVLSKEIYEVIAHLQVDTPRAEWELARLSDKMREIGYGHML